LEIGVLLRTHRTLLILFSALFVAMLGTGVVAPIMPLYAKTMGATGIWLGIIYSAFSISRAVFMPMTGKLSDRRGRKLFIVIGLTIYTLASFGYIWSHTVFELVWIRFLHGVGSAMIIPIAAAMIGDLSPEGKEGSMMGTFNVAVFLGFGAGPLLGGIVLDALGINEVFYLMGGLSGFSLLLIFFFLSEKKNDAIQDQRVLSSFRTLWRQDIFKGLLIFRSSNAVIRGTVTAFLPVFAAKWQIAPARIGLLVSVNILLTAVLQQVFGWMADRYNRRILMIVGNLVTAFPLFLTLFANSFFHLLILSIIMGIGSGLAFPAASAVATVLGRDHGMGNIMGYFNTAMSIGMIIGPIISGVIMDRFGLPVVFIFSGLIGIAGSASCVYYLVDLRILPKHRE
jgi:DHA1 family multidrug resistance protein-like MFS transporter